MNIKRSHFKTDDAYVDALKRQSAVMYALATNEPNSVTRHRLAASSKKLAEKAEKYIRRKVDLGSLKSTSKANRLAVRAAERNLAKKANTIKPIGVLPKPLINVTFHIDVFKEHNKYPMSRSVVGLAYEDLTKKEDMVFKYAVLKNDEDNVAWPIKKSGYYTLPLDRAMSLL